MAITNTPLKHFLSLIVLFTVCFSFSQSKNKTVQVKYITQSITIDADLNEKVWSQTKPATNFWQYFPTDSLQAQQQVEIRMLFDDRYLYVGIKVNAAGKNYIIPSLRRDFRARGNDNINLLFDTFNDGTNAFFFGTNPYGVRREALISGGGGRGGGFNTAWDTKWIGDTKIYDGYYISELRIPLSAFKYKEGETKWRFNSYHFDTQSNEQNTWINIPQNQSIFSLAFMGDMIFERPLGKSKSPISLIPFVSGNIGKDFETDISSSDFKIGGDAKFTVGNSLNLDLTVNPDFSQVEVDQQVTNLTRFEVSLPERRQFFIENSDLFGDFGDNRDANPFFSRRIGIANDINGNNIENDIIAGARLSGKLTNNLRIGVLNVQTAEDRTNEIPTTNNAVIALQQKVFSRSNVSFIFINKQPTKDDSFIAEENRFNRLIGLDYNLASADNTWVGKYFFHKSFSPNVSTNDFSSGISTEYNNRHYNIRLSGLYVGDNFRSELGFIRRRDILRIDPQIQRSFWPKSGKAQRHRLSITPQFIWRPELDFQNSDYNIMTRWQTTYQNNSEIEFTVSNRFTFLFNDFDPTGTFGAIPLPGNEGYTYSNFEISYRSDRRQAFSYNISPSYGEFFNGTRFSVRADLTWRIQPYFSGSAQINFDEINLPNPFPNATIILVGPRLDFTFTKNLFWATFIQYSNQRDNFSVNTRLQWRFAPLSDLFIVYNDNYFTGDIFAPRFRSLNLKLTYWLNI